MRKSLFAGLAMVALSAAATTDVTWYNLGNQVDESGKTTYVQRFVVTGDIAPLHRLAFNQFDRTMQAVNPGDTVVKIIPGYYYIGSERFGKEGSDSVVVDIVTGGTITAFSFGPDGVHGVDAAGKPFDVKFTRARGTDFPAQWVANGRDRMPYGETIFAINESLQTDETPSAYDIVPSFKSVTAQQGTYSGPAEGKTLLIANDNPEFYRITVAPEGITVEGASDAAAKMAWRTVKRLLDINGGTLPAAVIEDYPDFGYRGMMIDVARNNQPLSQMKKFVDAMADYRLNRLQFHFIDDEAWRLEIPGLPELTEVGARRGYTLDESDFLAQIYAGNGDPDNPEGTANGYMTRREFIDFLKYCNDLGIAVIPEVETPGHARASVKAMEARYHKTGDATYRMREDGDTSVYRSAQDFNDNVMNPALPGPYLFMDKVLDEIIAMYQEAGAPLETIHIGGDEVPHGAWSGSPSAQKFMKEHGMESESDLHAYWVAEMVKKLNDRGLKLSGWQEIALGKNEDYARSIAPGVGFINIWVPWSNKGGELPAEKAQRLGLPLLISAVTNNYFDLAYDYHPDERGLIWGGVVDEFKSLDGYPAVLAPKHPEYPGEIVGVQGQMWSETVRSPEWMDYYLFPKMLGMAERAWNADTTYTHAQFNKVIDKHEFPALAAKGINFRMRQPGVKIEDETIIMNSPYEEAVIRYTVDGTEPDEHSTVYTGPVSAKGVKEVRARLYHRGKESVTAIQPVK